MKSRLKASLIGLGSFIAFVLLYDPKIAMASITFGTLLFIVSTITHVIREK